MSNTDRATTDLALGHRLLRGEVPPFTPRSSMSERVYASRITDAMRAVAREREQARAERIAAALAQFDAAVGALSHWQRESRAGPLAALRAKLPQLAQHVEPNVRGLIAAALDQPPAPQCRSSARWDGYRAPAPAAEDDRHATPEGIVNAYNRLLEVQGRSR